MSIEIERTSVHPRQGERTYYDRDPRLQPFRVFIVQFRGGLEGLVSFSPGPDGAPRMTASDRDIQREADRLARELTRELRPGEVPVVADENALRAIGTIGVPVVVREYVCVLSAKAP